MLTDQSIQIDYGKLEKKDISAFDKRLTQKTTILNKHLHPSSPDKLKVRIQQPKQSQYYVDITLFNSVTIHSNGRGNNVVIALENAFTPLKENLLQQIDKQKDVQEKSPRQSRSQALNKAYGTLQIHVEARNLDTFSKELLPLLKDLKTYILRRLRYAHMIGLDKNRAITSSEALNQTIEQSYQRFENKRVDLSLEHWLFGIADELLDKDLRETEFEQQHMEDWDEYVDRALSDLDETIAMSAEGIPEMVEDLDEIDSALNIQPVEMGLTINYEENLSNKEQVERVMRALAKVPGTKRKFFELYIIEGFSIEEISKIYGMKQKDVQDAIDEVRTNVKHQLLQ